MSLQNIEFQREYRSLHLDICKQFYIPALKEAVSYKRSVGFFSSTALVEISLGLNYLVGNGGRIQLIASPKLSEEDIQAINAGYEKRDEIIEKCLLRELDKVAELKPYEEQSLNYLTKLIELGILDIKIAVLSDIEGIGIYHEKLGLISDDEGNTVAFTGSMNETASGMKSNYETVDVYTSWSGDAERVTDKVVAFERLWDDSENHVKVLEFPKIKEAIVKKYKKDKQTPVEYTLVDELELYLEEKKEEYIVSGIRLPENVELREYQIKAIDAWEGNGYRGIFDMATGTGKTYTGLAAIERLSKHRNGNLAIIIVVPYQHLVEQWVEDMEQFNLEPIVAYSKSKDKKWEERFKQKVNSYNAGVTNSFCVISTYGTFVTERFQNILARFRKHFCFVADEAHNLGAEKISKMLPKTANYRLALSATIERHRDEIGTKTIKDYFGETCISLSLKEAINQGFLTKYYYYPVLVYLAEDELEKYHELTEKISKLAPIAEKDPNAKESMDRLLIERARLVAGARNKLPKLLELMEQYKDDSHMLVYCGATKYKAEPDELDDNASDVRQIEAVTKALYDTYRMRVHMFTSNEGPEERENIKRRFKNGDDLQVITAIKCLDEGVNIPAIKRAFILASSTNPKEYVQRRGRVLRKANGKKYAEIYDFITLPYPTEDTIMVSPSVLKMDLGLIKREVQRMDEFAGASENPLRTDALKVEILQAYGAYELGDDDNEYERI